MSQLQVQALAPFPLDDVVAKVKLADGKHVFVLLENGPFIGDVPGSPHKLLLTFEPASQPGVLRPAASAEIKGEPAPADIDDLFEGGIAIPRGGKLVAQVLWGEPCHSNRLPATSEGRRLLRSRW